MRNLNTPTHGKFNETPRRVSDGIKRVGGTMLTGAIITAVCFQAAPIDKAFAETQTKPQAKQEVNVRATKTKVVDYCSDISRSTPKTLKNKGVNIVVRYVGYQSGPYAWKNLKRGEANALRKEGIDIVSVYETTAGWMRGGYPAGVKAAKIAKADTIANGGPKNPFVYFACDEDASYTNQVNAALKGAASVLGSDKVGIYGGYNVVDSALKTHSAAKGWQTQAWSQGKVVKGIALYQTVKPYAGDLGIDYDTNYAHKDDVGQWGTHTVTTSPAKKQAPAAPAAAAKIASKPAPKAAQASEPKAASTAGPVGSMLANLVSLFTGGARS